jgi:hypothetical protein
MSTVVSVVLTLHDDASVREKLTVMGPWDVMVDDERNEAESDALYDGLCELLKPGHSYRVTVEEVPIVQG